MLNYRQLHEEQLRENRPEFYRDLKRSGQLKAHLDHIAQEARDMHALIVKQMADRQPYDPAVWGDSRAGWEGALERTAEELVLHDLVFVKSPEDEAADRDGYTD